MMVLASSSLGHELSRPIYIFDGSGPPVPPPARTSGLFLFSSKAGAETCRRGFQSRTAGRGESRAG